MLLVFDVGNSDTTIGVFAGDTLRAHFRITTDAPRTPDEMAVLLRFLLDGAGIPLKQVGGAAICSVVPPVSPVIAEACKRVTGATPYSIDAEACIAGKLPVKLDVEEPRTVGADRVANTLAASRILKSDAIVVDLGTATTYDCVTADGTFLGGLIQPGVRVSAETLSQKTSKLPAVAIGKPGRAIGRNTEDNIQGGIVYGAAASIDGIVRRIRDEWPEKGRAVSIATGGIAPLIAPYCTELDKVEPWFTLHGIRIGYEFLTGAAGS